MAATLQQPQQQGNPQLKRLVYSKYREMLGSYNDKANTIIQSLPAYMVHEDKGFNFNGIGDLQNDHDHDTVDCGVPLPPSLPVTGSIPTRRIQTEAPPEPPACVQNAMMTKDKKPFTYTPGGIDLSQIKSPRMAKRIARNAQYEGVTNQPKPSPLAHCGNLAPAPLAASALGMPVQVFPTGPPPPPPAPPTSSSVPPPPPPPMKTQLAPQTNGRDTRKSPTPQNFEPPPLGCRPEIKIPANPMATLKKVAKPQPKNDFWVDEYRKERSKSPLITDNNPETYNEDRYEAPRMPSPPKSYTPAESSDPRMDINRIAFQQQNQQQRPGQQSAPSSQQQMYSPHMDVNRLAYQQQQQQPVRSPSPPKQQYHQQIQQQLQQQQQQLQQQQQSMQRAMPQHQQQRPASPVRTPVGQFQQQRQPPLGNPARVDSPFRSQDNPNLQRPLSPIKAAQQQQQQQTQPTYYIRQNQQQPRQDVTSPPPQQKPAQVGSIYIPPVAPENLAINSNSDQQSRQTPNSANPQQTPPWLAQRSNMKENPDWIREVNSTPATIRTQTPPISANQSGPGLRIQLTTTTSSNPKERIIPIQIEKTPTPTRTPSTPGFGPQPYYTNQQQFGSVPSPGSGYSSPGAGNAARNPNQFVDQGYNSYPNQQQRVMSPPVQQLGQPGGARIVPITIEKQDGGPFNPNVVRGPIAQSPTVIQNDPRALQQQQSWSNGAPNQSKSFRILQKITDTDAIGKDSDSEQSVVELQRPQYSRQMGAGNDSLPTEQMRRVQLNNDQDQGFVNRVSVQRQPQRYVQQRQDEQPQQYIHPSEQQVHEPKIYTGSAIPSRSFKILQAMTTPENAAEMEHSGVENEQISPYCPYPYPPPPYCLPQDDPNAQSDPSFYHYYPQYDTEAYGDYGNGYENFENCVDTPNIIITSSEENKDDNGHVVEPLMESGFESDEPQYQEQSALDMLSKRLSEIISPDFDQNISKDDKKYVGDNNKQIQNGELEIIKSPSPFKENSSEIENISEDESDDLLSSSSSSAEFGNRKDSVGDEFKDGLHAIKSVTNIKVYDTDEEEEEDEGVFGRKKEFKEDSLSESVEDVDQEGIVNSDSDIDEADDLTEDIEDVEIQEQLSVIFEEDASEADRINGARPESRQSTASTLSECSTTIANDDDNYDSDDKTDREENEDNSNLVTVRLPLRLSFSRSSNDENITTVVVGDSEIDDDKSVSTTYDRAFEKDEEENEEEEEFDGNDVSVTFSLTSRSNSIDRSGLLSKTPSVDHATSAKDWDDSDSEVSISVSLPMKRNKFMTQTLNNDVTNDVYEFKSPWDSSDDEGGDQEDETRRDDDTLIECIPETILEEPEEEEVDDDSEEEDEDDVVEEEPAVETIFKPNFWDIGMPKEEEQKGEEEQDEDDDSTSESSTSSESEELLQAKPTVYDKLLSNLKLEVPPTLKPLQESLSFTLNETKRICDETLNKLSNSRQRDDVKISVRDRIAAFESSPDSFELSKKPKQVIEIASNNTVAKKEILNRNSWIQKSESEMEEEDSGVTSDMSKPVSETDTEPECFPELRKMTRYQRAATHSRLFKLLQDESNLEDAEEEEKEIEKPKEPPLLRSRKKIIHNVSIMRKSNPEAVKNAETVSQRRERLSLPLKMSTSIDADNLSSSNSPSSPTPSSAISEKLINELVQSLLLKKDTDQFRNLPLEKLQAAAKKVLQEDLASKSNRDIDSLENTSIESTPVLTPQDLKNEYQRSYADYYESWNTNNSSSSPVHTDPNSYDLVPSKAFKTLQDQSTPGQAKKPLWSARCPRVLSSKTINRDLTRVAEIRESESPETYRSPRNSATPERSREFLRGTSLSRLGKV